jgi:hypothetical protein
LKLVFGADSSKHTSGIHALMRADMRCRLGREFLLAACNLELFVLHQRRSFLFLLVLCSNLQIVVYLQPSTKFSACHCFLEAFIGRFYCFACC